MSVLLRSDLGSICVDPELRVEVDGDAASLERMDRVIENPSSRSVRYFTCRHRHATSSVIAARSIGGGRSEMVG